MRYFNQCLLSALILSLSACAQVPSQTAYQHHLSHQSKTPLTHLGVALNQAIPLEQNKSVAFVLNSQSPLIALNGSKQPAYFQLFKTPLEQSMMVHIASFVKGDHLAENYAVEPELYRLDSNGAWQRVGEIQAGPSAGHQRLAHAWQVPASTYLAVKANVANLNQKITEVAQPKPYGGILNKVVRSDFQGRLAITVNAR